MAFDLHRHAASGTSDVRESPCPVCGSVLRPDELVCHSCTYGGLDAGTYSTFFWDEA